MQTEENKRLHLTESHNRSDSAEEEEYIKRYDAYKPKFQGLPEGYYPNTWGNIFLIICLFACLYCIAAGLFALFLKLLLLDTSATSWAYAGVGCGYVFLVISLIFIGQTMRRRLEKKYMEEALAKQNEMGKIKSKDNAI